MKVIEIFPMVRWIEVDAADVQRIEPHEQWALDTIRKERNRLLTECDWRVLPDSPTTNRTEWYMYRQALRDFPELVLVNKFNDVLWPAPPV